MMKIKMDQDVLKDQQAMLESVKHSKNIDMIWGKWLKGGESAEGGSDGRAVWDQWLREKGLRPGGDGDNPGEPEASNGWSEPIDSDDISDMEDDAWIAGGMRRPGERGSEDFSSDEVMNDDWEDDDDDHGGEMMPIPTI